MEFEELEFEVNEGEKPYNIRHRCFYFAKDVITFVKNSKYDYVNRSLFEQVIRSSTSIGANIVEGYAGSSKKDWKNYMLIGLKSVNETKYWLCLIRDTMQVDLAEVNRLLNEANELSKIIGRIVVNSIKS